MVFAYLGRESAFKRTRKPAEYREGTRIVKILITGNMGYVGPEVVKHLRLSRPDAILHGLDNAYFAHCLTGATDLPERNLDEQIYGDLRSLALELKGYDAVVQLAAISNDPMGKQFEAVTFDINQGSTVSTAKAAADAGVKNFVSSFPIC